MRYQFSADRCSKQPSTQDRERLWFPCCSNCDSIYALSILC
nr:MAG TPA: hypothetical protein [Caudoviricetes sp.]